MPKKPNKPLRSDEKRNDLMMQHQKLVFKLVHRFFRLNPQAPATFPKDDAISWGQLGLLKACSFFDASKGRTFGTFANKIIWRSIYRGFWRSNLIKIPSWQIHKAIKNGEIPKWEKVVHASMLEHYNTSSDDNVWSPPDKNEIDDDLEANEIKNRVRACIKRLHPRLQEIVIKRFLREMTGADIAREMGITRERVRQLVRKATRQLRSIMAAQGLDKDKLL